MTRLRDGTYDAIIIDAEPHDDGVALERANTSGVARGDVINIVTSSFVTRDPLLLVGPPCTLVVHDDEIRITQWRARVTVVTRATTEMSRRARTAVRSQARGHRALGARTA